jgi:hypothetical protein
LILAALHVDEVADDQPADVAQPKLARDLIRRFEICLQDRLLNVAPALVAAGVYVDGYERFRFIDYDVTAALQPDLRWKASSICFCTPNVSKIGAAPS